MSNLVEKKLFWQALLTRNISGIISCLDGANINADIGVRVFDILLSIESPEAENGLKVLLKNPNWNPNYQAVDIWHPEERAMLHHREDLALRVIKHPNFNQKEYPRVIRSATLLKAPKVLSYLNQKTRA